MNLAEAMAEQGWTLRLLDVDPPPRDVPKKTKVIVADVRDEKAVDKAAKGCDLVVDNAAIVPIARASRNELRSVNVDGCRTVLRAARKAGAYAIHVSSSSIYGVPRSLPVTEETPFAPFEFYGASKAEAEVVVAEERRRGQPIASLRSRALLGRGRLGLFELVFSQIRANTWVPMFGRGSNILQMCHARDFSDAVMAAADVQADGNYNIGAAVFGTVRDDLQALIERVGSTARLFPVPTLAIRAVLQPLSLTGLSPFTSWHWRSAGAACYFTIDKARDELGWEPQYTNVDALAEAYGHYLEGLSEGTSVHSSPLRGALARVLRGRSRSREG
jgi:nucleoside-diphosphate-sugar epimerase